MSVRWRKTPTVEALCRDISMNLYRAACAARINGEVRDLRTPLTEDCTLEILTFEDEDGQRAFNHTASHILAQAVMHLFPDTKFAIGPAIDNGFYYDFDKETPFTAEDLEKIEKKWPRCEGRAAHRAVWGWTSRKRISSWPTSRIKSS